MNPETPQNSGPTSPGKGNSSSGKQGTASKKAVTPAKAPAQPKPVADAPGPVPPLYRRIDWMALLLAFGSVWTVYFLTLAPEQTLEDSGELCTGAFYAGIPHPPGYPVWTIYAWLWTKLLAVGNVAWRVEVGESTAAAFACGLVALMVSRGSSMLMEGIEELKNLRGQWENAICLVSGVVAGMLLGFGGVMWSESVAINRISLFGVPWMMLVMTCLMRWIYAPHQKRYLYVAVFFFGICATIHQTLLCAAIGVEVAIACVYPKLGRDCFLANSVIFLAGLFAKATHLTGALDTAPILLLLFVLVGVGSMIAWVWLVYRTKTVVPTEWKTVIVMGVLWAAGASFYFYEAIAGMSNPPMEWGYPRTPEGFFHALTRGQYEKANPSNFLGDPLHFLLQIGMMIADIVHEYNWVCLFIALVPLLFFFKMKKRERSWMTALIAIYLCIGGLLLILMNPQPEKQSADLMRVFFTSSHGIIAVMIGYGFALIAAYMATHYQRFRVSYKMIGMVALAPALVAFYDAVNETFYGGINVTPYKFVLLIFLLMAGALVLTALAAEKVMRRSDAQPDNKSESDRVPVVGLLAGALCLIGILAGIVLFRSDSQTIGQMREGMVRMFAQDQYSLPAMSALLVLCVVVAFIGALFLYRQRAPLLITLGLFALMPLASGLAHWARSEQRNHWFGYWFGHDMFTPPFVGTDGKLTYDAKQRAEVMKDAKKAKLTYPEMARDAVLFGGTDPGRFNPTYMIFCDSFLPPSCQPAADPTFNRRDVYLITQNALADGTYLSYIRAQYMRSAQLDPPFFQNFLPYVFPRMFHGPTMGLAWLDDIFENLGAKIEKSRRTGTSWFRETDFTDLPGFTGKLRNKSDALSKFIADILSASTQSLLAGSDEKGLRSALAKDLNALLEGGLIYEPERFKTVKLPPIIEHAVTSSEVVHNMLPNTMIRLNRRMLEEAYPEIARSAGGVYPDTEIHTPTPEESQLCFNEYLYDAQKRLDHDTRHPEEPRQIKLGEDVHIDNGRVQVTGQVAVMSINALLTKVIYDKTPDHEFYVEESFPLEWMYPYLMPFGIIMQINRNGPLPELSQEICDRDHKFWSDYSDRTVGNWITYDTKVADICTWAEKTYLDHNYRDFKGNPKFLRDADAQKAFSKLRSSIGGIYQWRTLNYRSEPEHQRMLKEAEFAFKQSFAFCPYSPEAVYRFVQLLLTVQRVDDALLIAKTCLKLDPYNGQVQNLIAQLEASRGSSAQVTVQSILGQINKHIQAQQTNEASAMLDKLLNYPQSDSAVLMIVAQTYLRIGNMAKAEAAIDRITKLVPDSGDNWYNLAGLQAAQGKVKASAESLKKAFALYDAQPTHKPDQPNLHEYFKTDHNFDLVRHLPEFQQLMEQKK